MEGSEELRSRLATTPSQLNAFRNPTFTIECVEVDVVPVTIVIASEGPIDETTIPYQIEGAGREGLSHIC